MLSGSKFIHREKKLPNLINFLVLNLQQLSMAGNITLIHIYILHLLLYSLIRFMLSSVFYTVLELGRTFVGISRVHSSKSILFSI